MSISKKQLRKKGRLIFYKVVGIAVLVTIASIVFQEPFGLLIAFVGIFGATLYYSSAIANVHCPSCGKIYGMRAHMHSGIVYIPDKCSSCRGIAR